MIPLLHNWVLVIYIFLVFFIILYKRLLPVTIEANPLSYFDDLIVNLVCRNSLSLSVFLFISFSYIYLGESLRNMRQQQTIQHRWRDEEMITFFSFLLFIYNLPFKETKQEAKNALGKSPPTLSIEFVWEMNKKKFFLWVRNKDL